MLQQYLIVALREHHLDVGRAGVSTLRAGQQLLGLVCRRDVRVLGQVGVVPRRLGATQAAEQLRQSIADRKTPVARTRVQAISWRRYINTRTRAKYNSR